VHALEGHVQGTLEGTIMVHLRARQKPVGGALCAHLRVQRGHIKKHIMCVLKGAGLNCSPCADSPQL
jgi:hypothetical protein